MKPKAAGKTVELKACTPYDIPQLREIAEQSYRQHYLYLWREERYVRWYMNRSFSTESLMEQMTDANAVFFFVCYRRLPVGFVKLNENKNAQGAADDKSLELERIYLLKEASGKGVGTAAMKKIIQYATKRKKESIWLKSMDSSPSLRFYQKMGFVEIKGEQLPFEGLKDEYRTIITMQRYLPTA